MKLFVGLDVSLEQTAICDVNLRRARLTAGLRGPPRDAVPMMP